MLHFPDRGLKILISSHNTEKVYASRLCVSCEHHTLRQHTLNSCCLNVPKYLSNFQLIQFLFFFHLNNHGSQFRPCSIETVHIDPYSSPIQEIISICSDYVGLSHDNQFNISLQEIQKFYFYERVSELFWVNFIKLNFDF